MTAGFLVYVYPRVLLLLLAAAPVLLAVEAPRLRAELGKLSTRRGLRLLAGFAFAALLARAFAVEPYHRVFYDEIEHLNLSANVARLGEYGLTLVGGLGDFDVLKPPPLWPAGWHVMLAALFKLTGPTSEAAFALAAVLGALCVPLAWAAALYAFEDETAALCAAGLMAAAPLALKYSACADLSTPSLFWLLAATAAFMRTRSRRGAMPSLLFAACAAYAVNVRMENAAFCAPLVLAWARSRGARARWAAAAALAAAAAPVALVVGQNASMATNLFGGSARAALAGAPVNLAANLAWLCSPLSERGLLAALAIFGALRARSERSSALGPLLAGGALLLLAASLPEHGRFSLWYSHTASDRYALGLYPALVPLAGLGVARLLGAGLSAAPAAVAALALASIPAYASVSETILDERERAAFLAEAAKVLPPDTYVITHSPHAARVLLDRPAVDAAWLLEHREEFDARLAASGRSAGRVLFRDFWWDLRWNVSGPLERELWKAYDFAPVLERNIGGRAFAFYRLLPRKAPRPDPALWTATSLKDRTGR